MYKSVKNVKKSSDLPDQRKSISNQEKDTSSEEKDITVVIVDEDIIMSYKSDRQSVLYVPLEAQEVQEDVSVENEGITLENMDVSMDVVDEEVVQVVEVAVQAEEKSESEIKVATTPLKEEKGA